MQVPGVATEPRTLLKYAIEVALPRTTRLLGVLEPFLERVVYEVRSLWRLKARECSFGRRTGDEMCEAHSGGWKLSQKQHE